MEHLLQENLQFLQNYKVKLNKYALLCVYLYASEKIITQREEERGDRLKGSAVHWLKTFECQSVCDLSFNTEETGIEKISEDIVKQIDFKATPHHHETNQR
jgi:chloramphenicol 3-O-phosphotransferase